MLVDAHAHLHMYDAGEIEEVVAELKADQIRVIAVSMDPETFAATRAVAAHSDWIVPAFGIHPELAPAHVDELSTTADLAQAAACIGEIGLDHRFVTDASAYPSQEIVFDHLLAVAADQGKIVNLHTAGAEHQVADRLAHFGITRAIVHWYSGPGDAFDRLLDLGCHFTFGPEVGRSAHIAELAARTPADRLLTETDSPGGPEWLGLGRGRPSLVRSVVADLARIRGASQDEITSLVAANLDRLLPSPAAG